MRSSDVACARELWGAPTLEDVPVPARLRRRRLTDIAVYRGATGEWFIACSSGGTLSTGLGSAVVGRRAGVGDFDGDGKARTSRCTASPPASGSSCGSSDGSGSRSRMGFACARRFAVRRVLDICRCGCEIDREFATTCGLSRRPG